VDIDELHLKVYPVALGKGVPLFGTPRPGAESGPGSSRYGRSRRTTVEWRGRLTND
jgi:hypothetical protein